MKQITILKKKLDKCLNIKKKLEDGSLRLNPSLISINDKTIIFLQKDIRKLEK